MPTSGTPTPTSPSTATAAPTTGPRTDGPPRVGPVGRDPLGNGGPATLAPETTARPTDRPGTAGPPRVGPIGSRPVDAGSYSGPAGTGPAPVTTSVGPIGTAPASPTSNGPTPPGRPHTRDDVDIDEIYAEPVEPDRPAEYPRNAGPWSRPSTSPRIVAPVLPHRIPAPPDVPDVPGGLDDVDDDFDGDFDDGLTAHADGSTGRRPSVDGPELTRIASGLRQPAAEPPPPPEELDVAAVLAAVRQVIGVRDAQLRPNPNGVHTLRLDLAEGADAGWVSRQVARLLKERMGLAAEPRRPRPPAAPGGGSGATTTAPPASTGSTRTPVEPAHRPASLADFGPSSAAVAPGRVEGSTGPAVPRPPAHAATVSPGRAVERRPHRPTRLVLEQVHVATVGTEATVEVRLRLGEIPSVGNAAGPAVDGYLLRLAAQATAGAIDHLTALRFPAMPPIRCFIDHAGVVPFGDCVVAVVVLLVSGDGWVDQLVGSALVTGDPRHAVARATLDAVNRRLERLLGHHSEA
jgi:hypothetical protein